VRDIGPIEYSDPRELPAMIGAVKQADSVSDQDWHNMQLQLVDDSGCQGLSGDVSSAADGCITLARCLLCRADRGCDAVGNEKELDCHPPEAVVDE